MPPYLKKYITIAFILIAAGLFFYFVLPVSIPLLLAFITALFLSPVVKKLASFKKITRSAAVFIVFILFTAAAAALLYFLMTRALIQVNTFIENLPGMINEMNVAWMTLLENLRTQFDHLSEDIVDTIDQEVTSLLSESRNRLQDIDIIGRVSAIILAIPSYIVSLLVYLIALYLFLLDLPRLREKAFSYLKPETADKVQFMSSRLSSVIFGFFKAQFLVSLIIFAVTFIGLLFIAPEAALIMSILIWAIDFIPIIGSIAVLAPWAIFEFILGDNSTAVQLFILAAVLLTIRRTVEPKVMGHHIGLSPLATLISLYIGLMLLGAVGFILGPLLVILFSSAKEAGLIRMNFKI
ncbi:sporulation integral membrane protein YtvI [Alkalicoccus urumqiensis]|uniref:Sporulation integral membrane protein YtvI n=1 Tax=Alkalicoccus urumqiensis TaxID=1548213 RepID=A0A2P6MEM8_ALKUR|nr:sporulation integral membrane protein YtvI [Alkalicoccus urumqiensis]PRO64749.1 sporulation integral membrane protein YtvI [Alkalicoccus urumqiensis]